MASAASARKMGFLPKTAFDPVRGVSRNHSFHRNNREKIADLCTGTLWIAPPAIAVLSELFSQSENFNPRKRGNASKESAI